MRVVVKASILSNLVKIIIDMNALPDAHGTSSESRVPLSV